MKIPKQFIIYQTKHWLVNHRVNTKLPGYLMLSSKSKVSSLAAISNEALAELGVLQANIEKALTQILQPNYIYISRYGHMAGLSLHFHVIPVSQWVEDLFWQDQRYRSLQQFGSNTPETNTDGAELTLYIWREFCESEIAPTIQGVTITEIIELLRHNLTIN